MSAFDPIAMVGYGEVGRIFGAALVKAGASVHAFDVLVSDTRWASEARTRAARDGVHLVNDLAEAVANAGLVISAVTAGATATAASQIAAVAGKGSFVLDLNSAS